MMKTRTCDSVFYAIQTHLVSALSDSPPTFFVFCLFVFFVFFFFIFKWGAFKCAAHHKFRNNILNTHLKYDFFIFYYIQSSEIQENIDEIIRNIIVYFFIYSTGVYL